MQTGVNSLQILSDCTCENGCFPFQILHTYIEDLRKNPEKETADCHIGKVFFITFFQSTHRNPAIRDMFGELINIFIMYFVAWGD